MLDNVPVATPTWIAVSALILIAYLSGDLSIVEALGLFGVTSFGVGKIGEARNGAGRGVKH